MAQQGEAGQGSGGKVQQGEAGHQEDTLKIEGANSVARKHHPVGGKHHPVGGKLLEMEGGKQGADFELEHPHLEGTAGSGEEKQAVVCRNTVPAAETVCRVRGKQLQHRRKEEEHLEAHQSAFGGTCLAGLEPWGAQGVPAEKEGQKCFLADSWR